MSIFAFSSLCDNGLPSKVASPCFGKLHQALDKGFLVGRWRYIVQYLVLVGAVNTNILCRSVIRDFRIELRQFRHFDKVAETLFATILLATENS
jgi:hypothetical protein